MYIATSQLLATGSDGWRSTSFQDVWSTIDKPLQLLQHLDVIRVRTGLELVDSSFGRQNPSFDEGSNAWEGKNPGSIKVLLSNPRWERRLLCFLELSGVGRVVEDGRDEDQERAERMDRWIIWEAEERSEARGDG